MIGTGLPAISCKGCSLALTGPIASFPWSTDSGVPLVSISLGGRVIELISGGPLVNGGPTATDVVKCGSLAITDGSANLFDAAGDFSKYIV